MKRVLCSLTFILVASAAVSAQSFTYYFPQIAAGGGWKTSIFLSNTAANGLASGTITFTKSDATPFRANWVDETGTNVNGGGNTIAFQISAGQTRKFTAVGDLPLTVGYAKVEANASVLGAALFTQLDGAGAILAEAGVPMAIPLGKQAVFVDTTSGFRTGVAIGNPNNAVLDVQFELLDRNGQRIATVVRQIKPFEHLSLFTDELLPGAPEVVGRLQFFCTNPLIAVALRFSPSIQFTTLPPIAIAN